MKDEYNFSKGKKGSVIPIPLHQTKLTILIDKDILDWFGNQVDQANGGDYLELINNALREHIERQQKSLEIEVHSDI